MSEETEELDPEEYQELLEEIAEEQAEEDVLPEDYPKPKEDKNLFTLFENILDLKDNSKVSNLSKMELGDLMISVRDSQKINLLAKTLHHESFGKFFDDMGQITLATSMSKKGWLVENIVTQRKMQVKRNIDSTEPIENFKQKKWGWRTRNR